MSCPAGLTIAGQYYPCDWPVDENDRHDGWGHTNKEAEATWIGTERVPA